MQRRWQLGALLLVAVGLAVAGCGNAQEQQQLEVARQAVETGLESWKRGETAAALATGPTPIEFHDDDWQQSARLVAYEIESVRFETDGTPRCAVLLTVESRGGTPAERKVTYQVVTEPKVVIARDPFF